MKLDILAIAAHPDDAELSCSGTLLQHKQKDTKQVLLTSHKVNWVAEAVSLCENRKAMQLPKSCNSTSEKISILGMDFSK